MRIAVKKSQSSLFLFKKLEQERIKNIFTKILKKRKTEYLACVYLFIYLSFYLFNLNLFNHGTIHQQYMKICVIKQL